MLATVSHNLRTPLNGIIGMLDLVLDTILDTSVKKSIQLAYRSSKMLLFMINDLLDLTRISNGKLKLNAVTFKIEDVVRDVYKLIKFQAKNKGIGLKYIIRANSPCIRSDPNRVKQVLLNLLSNALKFTEKGEIALTVEPKSPASEAVNFSVRDTGCGIKEGDIPNLFKLFGKLHNSEANKLNTTGIGLGLAISQSLVRTLNESATYEEISVISEYGKGSTFSFSIHPIHWEQSIVMPGTKNSDEFISFDNETNINLLPRLTCPTNFISTTPTRAQNTKMRLLIVDDDQINILVLSSYVRSFPDCEFKTASNGKEALDLVLSNSKSGYFFDVVLMDCNMPVMNGFEAARTIINLIEAKVITPLIIIACTANTSILDSENCFKSGMSDLLSKPFTKSLLREKLDKFKTTGL